jgi:hypothetical protein
MRGTFRELANAVAHPWKTPASRHGKAMSSERPSLCWSKPDSNHQSRRAICLTVR